MIIYSLYHLILKMNFFRQDHSEGIPLGQDLQDIYYI